MMLQQVVEDDFCRTSPVIVTFQLLGLLHTQNQVTSTSIYVFTSLTLCSMEVRYSQILCEDDTKILLLHLHSVLVGHFVYLLHEPQDELLAHIFDKRTCYQSHLSLCWRCGKKVKTTREFRSSCWTVDVHPQCTYLHYVQITLFFTT